MEDCKKWAAVAVTCRSKQYARAVEKEFELRQSDGALPKDVIFLCVTDPQEGLGSGGATVNALLVVAEHLSVKNGLTVVSADVIENMRILIIHMGRFYSYDSCGRAFASLPSLEESEEHENFFTNFDLLFKTISQQLNAVSPPGVWICSSDMIFTVPKDLDIDLNEEMNMQGVCCISVPADIEYARDHGVYKIDDKGIITDIIYRGTDEQIRTCLLPSVLGNDRESASLVSGIVFFSFQIAAKLLSLHDCTPLNTCTYLGIDSGFEPLQISLYFDILLSMARDVTKSDFVSGKRGSPFGDDCSNFHNKNMQKAREVMWEKFQGTELKAVVIPSGKHHYLDMTKTPQYCISVMREQCRNPNSTIKPICKASFIHDGCKVSNGSIIINSLVCDEATIGSDCLISHCHLKGAMTIGKNCYIMGLDEDSCELLQDIEIPDNSFLMGLNIDIEGLGGKKVFCCLKNCHKFSVSDDLNYIVEYNSSEIIKGVSYGDLLRTAINDAGPSSSRYVNVIKAKRPTCSGDVQKGIASYFMAKIFPVLSIVQTTDVRDCIGLLKNSISVSAYKKWKSSWKFSICDLLEQTDHHAEFSYRHDLSIKIQCAKIRDDLLGNKGNNLQSFYSLAVLKKKHDMLLSMLDEVALTCVEENKTHLCTRVFACIAEVLAKVAGDNAGLRSGPAENREWKKALLLLERGEFKKGIIALSSVRRRWLNDTDKLVRAARHYERAEHIFVQHACLTVSKFITTSPGGKVDTCSWLVCDASARIDLSGGWTDTPPICYEHGGTVINVALKIEDKRPIGARVRFIDDLVIVLKMFGSDTGIVCDTLESFRDYCLPQAPGALLKACFILCEIFSLDSKLTLKEQLMMKYGKGIEIQTWSKLPRGSGLGTSSILAGVAIAALFRAVGLVADTRAVIHAVLMLEQMMTTGGGWQDQVGGMVGGIKSCSSETKLPLEIYSKPISVSDEFLRAFEDRIKLIYTGITRLARNMLQDVLRNWYARKPSIIANCDNLVSNALKCEKAFLNGDLVTLGECINEYWKQKKIMAPGCEPASCARIMRKLEPLVLGQTLAGAGGGGFLFVLLKEPQTNEYIMSLLKDIKGAEDVAVYKATVDLSGAQLSYQSVE